MNVHQMIESCLFVTLYQTPELITMSLGKRYEKFYKVATVERRLREMREKGMCESKEYPNKVNKGARHNRWKQKEKAQC